jgi:regulator of replication initiation timing
MNEKKVKNITLDVETLKYLVDKLFARYGRYYGLGLAIRDIVEENKRLVEENKRLIGELEKLKNELKACVELHGFRV